jgi:hypothetical protein
MALCTPRLIGPVSELSTSVEVEGLAAGAKVVVAAIGPTPRDVATSASASGGRDQLTLLPGVSLQAKDQLVVTETLGGDQAKTPAGMELGVQPAPASAADVGPVGYVSHLYECGQKVWVSGALPGAQFEVEFGVTVQGTDLSLTGDGHV